jgi:hypothetical protein
MKLVTFLIGEDIQQKIGVLTEDGKRIVALEKASEAMGIPVSFYFKDMISFLSGSRDAVDISSDVVEFALSEESPAFVVAVDSVTLLSRFPVQNP